MANGHKCAGLQPNQPGLQAKGRTQTEHTDISSTRIQLTDQPADHQQRAHTNTVTNHPAGMYQEPDEEALLQAIVNTCQQVEQQQQASTQPAFKTGAVPGFGTSKRKPEQPPPEAQKSQKRDHRSPTKETAKGGENKPARARALFTSRAQHPMKQQKGEKTSLRARARALRSPVGSNTQ